MDLSFIGAVSTDLMKEKKWDRLAAGCLLALILLVIALETRDLFVYPVIDTGMWFGDESWTMATLASLLRDGIARVPEALGSSLSTSNGFVNGSVWVASVCYGLPALVFHGGATPVEIGRVVSLIATLGILGVIYALGRRLGASAVHALLGILLLVVSPGFHLLSHCARLDLLTGLAVLAALYSFLWLLDAPALTNWHYLLLGLSVALSLSIYVHVPTLIAVPALWTLFRLKSHRRDVLATIAGAIGGLGILAIGYWLTTGEFYLLGRGGAYNQYFNVARSIPIMHPFSWQVQRINTIARFLQVFGLAPQLIIALTVGFCFAPWLWRTSPAQQSRRRFAELAILVTISWMAFEGPAVFYNMHMLPVFTVVAIVLIASLWSRQATTKFRALLPLLSIGIGVVLVLVAMPSEMKLAQAARTISDGNHRAVASLLGTIPVGVERPLVLTDEPAYDLLVANPRFALMTKHLFLFGGENKTLADILREHRVGYLLLYSTSRWQSPLRPIADSLYMLIGEERGVLTDQARGYDRPMFETLDTLRLYQARK